MRMPSERVVQMLRNQYAPGTRVKLLHMDDRYAPPRGTEGTVRYVDDAGTVHVAWDNGSGLGAVYGEDLIAKV